jgi:hypothetical protein
MLARITSRTQAEAGIRWGGGLATADEAGGAVVAGATGGAVGIVVAKIETSTEVVG